MATCGINDTVIACCVMGGRSARAYEELMRINVTNIKDFLSAFRRGTENCSNEKYVP